MDTQWTKKLICMGRKCITYTRSHGYMVPVFNVPEVCVLVETLHATKIGERSIFRVPALGKEWHDQKSMSAEIWEYFMDFPRTKTIHWTVTPARVDEQRPVIYGHPYKKEGK